MILRDSINSLVMSGCIVWCRLVGLMLLGLFLREYGYVSLD